MQARRSLVLLIILTLFTFSANPAGAAGRSASSIPNTILSGKGAPTLKMGINGDFYIDTRSLLIYGPKKNGKWSNPKNLQGPIGAAGANGSDGKSGSDGKNGSDGKSVAGVSTTAGPVGPIGATGPAGPAGATGPAGPSGAQGATGPAGATGASGSGTGTPGPQGATGATGPQGATGAAGAAGPAGATGANGAAGSTGPAGATGAAGLNGATAAVDGTLTFSDISGITGTAQPSTVEGFKAGKSYVLRAKIWTYQPNDAAENFMPLSLTATGINGTPILVSRYLLSHSYSYRTSTPRFENSIDIDLTLDGSSSATDYGVTFTVTAGRSTAGTALLRLEGSFLAIEVQSVSSTF
jgi:hypothetical protein